mmetsp:Transcript_13876/g.21633  ORF Transcript_13876/g.21633 Transcript_13876/m.21633 type:complete len:83 (-) Transcript_13876:1618-1866(-)
MRLLSFFGEPTLQPSDFERLLSKEAKNPFLENQGSAKEAYATAMGGGLKQAELLDWKLSAIHAIGQAICGKYDSVESSFDSI